MAHGHPDWGISQPQTIVNAVTDLGELSARLGAIRSQDRLGLWIYADDFRHGLGAWRFTGSSGSKGLLLTAEYFLSGGVSVWLRGDPSGGGYTNMVRDLPFPPVAKLGCEIFLSGLTNSQYVRLKFDWGDGSATYTAALRYTKATDTLEVYTTGGTWQAIAAGTIFACGSGSFMGWKLVADFDDAKYVRAIINGTEYDLSAIDLYQNPITGYPYGVVTITAWGLASSPSYVYVDSVVVTRDEP